MDEAVGMVILCFALLLSLLSRMLYTELLRLWDEAVQAADAKDWQGALSKLEQISEPTSRTLFNAASAHLVLGQLDEALKVCVYWGIMRVLEGDLEISVNTFKSSDTSSLIITSIATTFPLCDVQALDLTISKDKRLAVGFFQRSAVMMQIDR